MRTEKTRTRVRRRLIGAVLLTAIIFAFAAIHDVPTTSSREDAAAAQTLLKQAEIKTTPTDFQSELDTIGAIQRQVLAAAPIDRGIPHGERRGLSDVLRLGYGLCYDRSRAIEIVLREVGFETRHAAVYSLVRTKSPARALMTKGNSSHAVTEVKTSRGWMLVGSNEPWLGLTKSGEPVDLAKLEKIDPRLLAGEPNGIFTEPFTWVYGLYSRHGGFFPPYTPFPDVNWAEFAQNF